MKRSKLSKCIKGSKREERQKEEKEKEVGVAAYLYVNDDKATTEG